MFDGQKFTHAGHNFRVSMATDCDTGAPWIEHDGHGIVSDWTSRDKKPGELVLACDGRGRARNGVRRFYDFAETVKIARRDGWGIAPYKLDIERGANGLMRANAQWFEGRQLVAIQTDWSDDINDATRQAYAMHRATFPSARTYAAAAAMADFERLRAWCADEWYWVGVTVELLDDFGDAMGETESLWGIESDADEHIGEVARELAGEIIARMEQSLTT